MKERLDAWLRRLTEETIDTVQFLFIFAIIVGICAVPVYLHLTSFH